MPESIRRGRDERLGGRVAAILLHAMIMLALHGHATYIFLLTGLQPSRRNGFCRWIESGLTLFDHNRGTATRTHVVTR